MNANDVPTMDHVEAIRASGLSIYDAFTENNDLLIPTIALEGLLKIKLLNADLISTKPKTRSKVLKQKIAEVLGYAIPKSFRRRTTEPSFIGQNFDTYGQQADNLQVWNQGLVADRRYVIVSVGEDNRVRGVRVVVGDELIELARKQTLTHKLQARFSTPSKPKRLLSENDEPGLTMFLGDSAVDLEKDSPGSCPAAGALLPIKNIFERLSPLVGMELGGGVANTERTGGDLLHKKVCEALGFKVFAETGQFPDVRNQLLEVKLQTSKTIDLGHVEPSSCETLDIGCPEVTNLMPCEVRYAVVGGRWVGKNLKIESLSLVTGRHFFDHFKQFGGRGKNSKIQIKLPAGFFDAKG